MSKVIYTPDAPAAIGPYSQAIVAGNLVFTSGQIPINPATGAIEAVTIQEQTEQVCKNIQAVHMNLYLGRRFRAKQLLEDAVFSESKVYDVDSSKPKENATGN
jgi:enamine deaminase RidA (YjgF/YER057c/UK114 family)